MTVGRMGFFSTAFAGRRPVRCSGRSRSPELFDTGLRPACLISLPRSNGPRFCASACHEPHAKTCGARQGHVIAELIKCIPTLWVFARGYDGITIWRNIVPCVTPLWRAHQSSKSSPHKPFTERQTMAKQVQPSERQKAVKTRGPCEGLNRPRPLICQ